MKKIIIIPARFQSTRFPGKPLMLLNGKAAVLWTLETARAVLGVDDILVATDDRRISDEV